ncbi:putative membrane component involved in biofilm formation [Bacillus freudenreichii]|nr:putative membrane component involved in biofilm formation [Bacillus freudenreichii]
MIKEWNLLRVIACLSVVLLHSSTQTARILGHPQTDIYHLGRILLCYATPTFIVLSMIIIANRYPLKLPGDFWGSRFKYIFLPFISFGIIDALVVKYLKPALILDQKILDNILTGKFIGWFILVIFQFYLLHYLVIRFKLSMKWLFPLSLFVMFGYLFLLNTEKITLDGFSYMLKFPFLAWFGYFTAAFIVGKHYKVISEKLLRFRWVTLLFLFVSIGIVYVSYRLGITEVDSRRMDLYPLVLSVSAVILAWGQLIPKLKLIDLISNYSFGIYLLHWQYQRLLGLKMPFIAPNYTLNVLVLFLLSLIASMITIKVISLLPFGSFIIGKTKRNKKRPVKPINEVA